MIELPTQKSRIAVGPSDNIMLFYGPPGVGKTTFVNGLADRVLFASTDRGTRHLNTLRVECLKWKAFEDLVVALEKTKGVEYDIICIDHVDDWAAMAEETVCRDLGVDSLGDAKWGKGWKAFSRKMRSYVRRILNLGMGVMFIAHEDSKKVSIGGVERDRFMPEMGKGSWKAIVPLADIVGYCGFMRVKKEGQKKGEEIRIIRTQPIEEIYAKDRTRRSKPELGWEPLDPIAFIESFKVQYKKPGKRAK